MATSPNKKLYTPKPQFSKLPHDILVFIFSHFISISTNPLDDLQMISGLSKSFFNAAQDHRVYQHINVDKFQYLKDGSVDTYHRLLLRCGAKGNPKANFILGVISSLRSFELYDIYAFRYLEKAVISEFLPAAYFSILWYLRHKETWNCAIEWIKKYFHNEEPHMKSSERLNYCRNETLKALQHPEFKPSQLWESQLLVRNCADGACGIHIDLENLYHCNAIENLTFCSTECKWTAECLHCFNGLYGV